MTDLLLSTEMPSRGRIEAFDLVTVDGRLLLVAVDSMGDRLFTWNPSDDRWTPHGPLRQPWRPADFLSSVGRPPTDDDDGYPCLTLCAAVVNGRIVVGGGNYEMPFAQWDVATGEVRTYARLDHAGVATTMTTELDGRPFFLAGGQSGFLRVWDASRRDAVDALDAESVLLDAHQAGIGGLAGGTLNGRPVVLSGDWNGDVLLWDLRDRNVLRHFEGCRMAVKGLGLATVDGRDLVVVAGGNRVMLGDPDTRKWVATIKGGKGITCMDVGVVDGRPIAVTGSGNGHLYVWDLQERRALRGPFTEQDSEVKAVRVISLDGRDVAITTDRNGRIRVWRL